MSSQDKPAADVAEQLTPVNLVRSLRSCVCPACGGPKGRRKTFCLDCFNQLSPDNQRQLYQGLEQGYETAVLRALRVLGVTRFILPTDSDWGSATREGRP